MHHTRENPTPVFFLFIYVFGQHAEKTSNDLNEDKYFAGKTRITFTAAQQ